MQYITYRLGAYFRRMAVRLAGDPAKPALVCVHGLTRNSHDFDRLIDAFADDFYIVAPDLPGRGASDWLESPAVYQPLSYCEALSHLLAWLDRPVLWLGTSLGGICGMLLAAAQGTPITKLVLNDIGPFIPKAALARIASYIVAPEHFSDLGALEAYLRTVQSGFAPMSDADWRHMAETSCRDLPDGGLALHYDPAIATAVVSNEPQDVDLWPVYRAIRCPVMVIRGETSDLLTAELFAEMTGLGAAGRVVAGAGHAPSLNDRASIAAIREFLGDGSAAALPVA